MNIPPDGGHVHRFTRVSYGKIAALAVLAVIGIYFLVWAQFVLVPIVFAFLFALTLRPLVNRISVYVPKDWIAILITFLIAAIPLMIAIFLFTYQTVEVLNDIPTITEELQESVNRMFDNVTSQFDIEIESSGYEWLSENAANALDDPFVYVSGVLAGGAGLIGSLTLILIYTFLMLLYRRPIYNFILGQFSFRSRYRMEMVLSDTQRMSFTYLRGLGIVMLILGVLNSVGLTLIGIDYAFFWGFLAAILAIIPYVGTFVGGLLPFIYALTTTDTAWQPMAVVALFVIVQSIEGNIITPKVVGSSIQINPLAAIIFLFFGGLLWGIPGLILALPFTAILRIVLVHSGRFRPFGLLLSSELLERDEEFLGRLDAPYFRIINFFRESDYVITDED